MCGLDYGSEMLIETVKSWTEPGFGVQTGDKNVFNKEYGEDSDCFPHSARKNSGRGGGVPNQGQDPGWLAEGDNGEVHVQGREESEWEHQHSDKGR